MSIAALIAATNFQRIQELLEENEKEKKIAIQKCLENGESCSYGICSECPAKRDND